MSSQGNLDLIEAAKKGKVATVVRLLTRPDVDKNFFDQDGETALHRAAGEGHLEVVNALLQAGSAADLQDKINRTPLFIAAGRNHLKVVNALLQARADVNLQTKPSNWTALHRAAKEGRQPIVNALLRAGADVHLQNKDGWTALRMAAENGHLKVVDALLQAGVSEDGWIALFLAVGNGHLEVVNALLQAGVDVNLPTKSTVFTALHRAARQGYLEVLNALLQAGANPNRQDENGSTSLYIAAMEGHLEMVNALLWAGAGAVVNLQNLRDKWTALHWAAKKDNLEMVNALLHAGADANLQTEEDGYMALYWAADNSNLKMVNVLLQAGANAHLQTKSGWTALHCAAKMNCLEVIDALLQAGVAVNLQNNGGETALHKAAAWGRQETMNALLQAGAVVDMQDKGGCTALHRAADRGHLEMVNTLLRVGAYVNLQNMDGWIALHWAANNGHVGVMVALLLQTGADVNMQTYDGWTPLHLAAKKRHLKMVNALLQAGADANLQNVDGKTALDVAETREIKAPLILWHMIVGKQNKPPLPVSQPSAPPQPPLLPSHSRVPVPALNAAPIDGTNTTAEVEDAVKVVLAQAAGVQARREWMQRRDALQAQCDAARVTKKYLNAHKFKKELELADIQSLSLALSLEDYQTLFDRYTDLVSTLEVQCEKLFVAGDGAALEAVATLLEPLQSLDPTVLKFPSANLLGSGDADFSKVTLHEAVLPEKKFYCGAVPIFVSTCLDVPAVRKLYRGKFSDTVFSTARNTKVVNDIACVIKCAVCADRSNTTLESSVHALRHEYSMFSLIQALVRDNQVTGCVHCYSAHPSYHYLVLEDHGQDLTHLLNPQLENGQQVVRAIVEAVQALHSLSVMHGDIKPQNMLFRYTFMGKCEVKLCDLDAAHQVGKECVASTLGTKYFHPPEIYCATAEGSSTKIKAALEKDLFALGLVMWQVLQRSPLPALSHASESQLDRCYADQATLWEHLPVPARGQWSHQYLQSLTSLESRKRMSASTLLTSIQVLDASSAQHGWLQEQQRNERMEKNVSGKLDAANAKLDRVLEVLQRKFDALGQEVVGVAATLRKEMLLGREQVLEGMVQATQDTLKQLLVKAPDGGISSNNILTGAQIANLLSTLQSRIEESVTAAISDQNKQQSSFPPSQAAITEMAQFRAQFSTLSADLQVFMVDQRRAQVSSSATLQDQQKQVQQMQQCLTTSLQDVLMSGLSDIKQKIAQLRQGQEQLGRQIAVVLTRNTELAAMVNTLITGTHSIPTFAIILPVVSTSWRSPLNPLRLVRNRFRLYFLCSHTHRIAPCGSKGKGYKINVTKQWVQDAAPVLRVGLVLVNLALLSAGLPLPVPDLPTLLSTSGLHAKYLDAALHLVQNPADDKGGAEFDMDKAVDELAQEGHILQEQGMGKGGMALQEGSRKAYETIQEVLRKDGINIALTSGLRQVTHGGKTAWVLDSDDVEAQFRATW